MIATNKARKARLAEIARDRLAYQEYVDVRDGLDKNITLTYAKLQKKDGPKVMKKKKKGELNGGINGVNGIAGPPVPLPNPASSGLTHDDEGQLVVPEALMSLVHARMEWEECIGKAFEERSLLVLSRAEPRHQQPAVDGDAITASLTETPLCALPLFAFPCNATTTTNSSGTCWRRIELFDVSARGG